MSTAKATMIQLPPMAASSDGTRNPCLMVSGYLRTACAIGSQTGAWPLPHRYCQFHTTTRAVGTAA